MGYRNLTKIGLKKNKEEFIGSDKCQKAASYTV